MKQPGTMLRKWGWSTEQDAPASYCADARAILRSLEAQLQQSDMEALLTFSAQREALQDLPEAPLLALEEALQGLEFEAALLACRELLAQVG